MTVTVMNLLLFFPVFLLELHVHLIRSRHYMLKLFQEISNGNHIVSLDVISFLNFIDRRCELIENGIQLRVIALFSVCDRLEIEVLLLELIDSVGHYLNTVFLLCLSLSNLLRFLGKLKFGCLYSFYHIFHSLTWLFFVLIEHLFLLINQYFIFFNFCFALFVWLW